MVGGQATAQHHQQEGEAGDDLMQTALEATIGAGAAAGAATEAEGLGGKAPRPDEALATGLMAAPAPVPALEATAVATGRVQGATAGVGADQAGVGSQQKSQKSAQAQVLLLLQQRTGTCCWWAGTPSRLVCGR